MYQQINLVVFYLHQTVGCTVLITYIHSSITNKISTGFFIVHLNKSKIFYVNPVFLEKVVLTSVRRETFRPEHILPASALTEGKNSILSVSRDISSTGPKSLHLISKPTIHHIHSEYLLTNAL